MFNEVNIPLISIFLLNKEFPFTSISLSNNTFFNAVTSSLKVVVLYTLRVVVVVTVFPSPSIYGTVPILVFPSTIKSVLIIALLSTNNPSDPCIIVLPYTSKLLGKFSLPIVVLPSTLRISSRYVSFFTVRVFNTVLAASSI